MVDRALEDEARALLAADRRSRNGEAEDFRRRIQLFDTQKKADDAGKRRRAMLKDASRVNSLSFKIFAFDHTYIYNTQYQYYFPYSTTSNDEYVSLNAIFGTAEFV